MTIAANGNRIDLTTMVRNLEIPDMECVKSGTDLAPELRPKATKSSKAKAGRSAKSNTRARVKISSDRSSEFASFADQLRVELNPRGPLEGLIAAHVIQSAWRFKTILDRIDGRELGDQHDNVVEASKSRSTSTVDRAGRSLRDALESLDYVRNRQARPNPTSSDFVFDPQIESNEWPIVPTDGLDYFQTDAESSEDEVPNWRDRLVFDFEVSDVSPVVKGTWITVSHVISLIVDGWTWADVLRSHPELSEDDIRTCVAYAMAEENSAH
jgi:uncharacterized protein (DUF433 family)